jgi:hypothetical protein
LAQMATFGLYFKSMTQAQANELRARLNTLAKHHGYLAARGPTTGEGNAADLLAAIAFHRLAVVGLPEVQRRKAVPALRQLADEQKDDALARAFTTLADALELTAGQATEQSGFREVVI